MATDPKDPTLDEDEDDDALAVALRKNMEGYDAGDPDQSKGGLDDPAQTAEAPRETSEYDEDRRKNGAAPPKKAGAEEEATPDPKDGVKTDAAKPEAAKPEDTATPDKAAQTPPTAEQPAAAADPAIPSAEEMTAALAAMPENVRTHVESQLTNYRNFMAPLLAQKDQLKAMGTTPEGAVEWFISVNDFATRKPDEYIEWVLDKTLAGNTEGQKKAVERLAAKIGMSLVPAAAAEEDDPFISESEKEAKRELAALKAAQAGTPAPIGPDSPVEQNMRIIQSVRTELNPQYLPVRPHFDKVAPLMVPMIQQHVAEGKPIDRKTVAEFYDAALLAHPETRAEAVAKISAAQAAQIVRDSNKDTAAATAKARKASTSIIDSSEPGLGSQTPRRQSGGETLEQALARNFAGFTG